MKRVCCLFVLKITVRFPFRLEDAIQLVRVFQQTHPDLASSQYVTSHQMQGFDALWVSCVNWAKSKANLYHLWGAPWLNIFYSPSSKK